MRHSFQQTFAVRYFSLKQSHNRRSLWRKKRERERGESKERTGGSEKSRHTIPQLTDYAAPSKARTDECCGGVRHTHDTHDARKERKREERKGDAKSRWIGSRKTDRPVASAPSSGIASRANARDTADPEYMGKGIYRAAGAWPHWRRVRHQRGDPCRSSWTARRPPSRRWCSRRSPSRALAGDSPPQHVVVTAMMTMMMMVIVVVTVVDTDHAHRSTSSTMHDVLHTTVQFKRPPPLAAVAATTAAASWHLLRGWCRVGTARTRSRSHTRTRERQQTYYSHTHTHGTQRKCATRLRHIHKYALDRTRSCAEAFSRRHVPGAPASTYPAREKQRSPRRNARARARSSEIGDPRKCEIVLSLSRGYIDAQTLLRASLLAH